MSSKDTAGVLAPPPLIFIVFYFAGYGLEKLYPLAIPHLSVMRYVCWLFIICAGLLAMSAILTMHRAGTSENPYSESKALVTSGPFRFTRNPMYLALVFVYLAVTLFEQSLWSFLTLPLAILTLHFGVILREEKYLERIFTDQYRAYLTQVRRWL